MVDRHPRRHGETEPAKNRDRGPRAGGLGVGRWVLGNLSCFVPHAWGVPGTRCLDLSGFGIRTPAPDLWPLATGAWTEWPHLERSRSVRIDQRRSAAAPLTHQRGQASEQRGYLFWRRQRAFEERELQHARRHWLDHDGYPIDTSRRRMRLEIEQDERAQYAWIAEWCGELQRAGVDLARNQPQPHMEHDRTSLATLETRAQRIEQPTQREGKRLEALDRVVECQRDFKPILHGVRHKRSLILTPGEPLQRKPARPQPFEEVSRGKRRPDHLESSDPTDVRSTTT